MEQFTREQLEQANLILLRAELETAQVKGDETAVKFWTEKVIEAQIAQIKSVNKV